MNTLDFSFEKRLWDYGHKLVAGMDEVGRGCFAGPVVAASVVFEKEVKVPDGIIINDSKKLTKQRRKKAYEWICENAAIIGVGRTSVHEINKNGMSKAISSAFRRAIRKVGKQANNRVDYLLIDAFFVPYIQGFPVGKKTKNVPKNLNDKRARQLAVKNGDNRSFSIAAASIVAKVERDDLMIKMGQNESYKKYDWENNKGYGTKAHREAIIKHGITKYHRIEFVKTFFKKSSVEV